MLAVIVRRLIGAVPLLLLISIVAFTLALLLPGDPAQALAGENATPAQLEAAREELNLDDPIPVRYVAWLGDIVQGDLGVSAATGRSVTDEVIRRFPVTASVAGMALLFGLVVGVPLGVLQGTYAGRLPDRILLVFSSLGLSTPNFWLATLLVGLFAVSLGWLPARGYTALGESPLDWFRHLALPMLALGVFAAGEAARQVRTGLLGVLESDYIRAARARGLGPLRVIGKHALKNGAMPALTIMGLRVGTLFAGSVIIESIFGLPGLGDYALKAIRDRDYAVIQTVILLSGTIVIVVNLLVDVAYAALNPKVRVG